MLQEDLNANIWAETAIIPASNAGTGHENAKNWLIQCGKSGASPTSFNFQNCVKQNRRQLVQTLCKRKDF